jgi:hypothetical protein
MNLVGGVLEEDIHFYTLFIPNVQVEITENPQKGRPYEFMETVGGSYGFAKE